MGKTVGLVFHDEQQNDMTVEEANENAADETEESEAVAETEE